VQQKLNNKNITHTQNNTHTSTRSIVMHFPLRHATSVVLVRGSVASASTARRLRHKVRHISSWVGALESAEKDTSICFSPTRPLTALARSVLLLPKDALHWTTASQAFGNRTVAAMLKEVEELNAERKLLVLRALLRWQGPPVRATISVSESIDPETGEVRVTEKVVDVIQHLSEKICMMLLVRSENGTDPPRVVGGVPSGTHHTGLRQPPPPPAPRFPIQAALRSLTLEEVESLKDAPVAGLKRQVAAELFRRYEASGHESTHLSPALGELRDMLLGHKREELDEAIVKCAKEATTKSTSSSTSSSTPAAAAAAATRTTSTSSSSSTSMAYKDKESDEAHRKNDNNKAHIALCTQYILQYLDKKPLLPLGFLRPKLWDAPKILTAWTDWALAQWSIELSSAGGGGGGGRGLSSLSDAEFVLRVGLRQCTPLELVQCADRVLCPPRIENVGSSSSSSSSHRHQYQQHRGIFDSGTRDLFHAALEEQCESVVAHLYACPLGDLARAMRAYASENGADPYTPRSYLRFLPGALQVLGTRLPEMRLKEILECIAPLNSEQLPEFEAKLRTFFLSPPKTRDTWRMCEGELDMDLSRKFNLMVALADRGFEGDHWLMERVLETLDQELAELEEEEQSSNAVPVVVSTHGSRPKDEKEVSPQIRVDDSTRPHNRVASSTTRPLDAILPQSMVKACRHLNLFERRHPHVAELILNAFGDTRAMRAWMRCLSSHELTTALEALGRNRKQVDRELVFKTANSIVKQAFEGERVLSVEDWERMCSVEYLDYATQIVPEFFPLLVHTNPTVLSQFSRDATCTFLQRLASWAEAGGKVEYYDQNQRCEILGPLTGVKEALFLSIQQHCKGSHPLMWKFNQLDVILDALARLGWHHEGAFEDLCIQAMRIEHEVRVPVESMLSILQSIVALRVYHGPLLDRFVNWYVWYVDSFKQHELKKEEVDNLCSLANSLACLNYHSLGLSEICERQLPNATPPQKLRLCTALVRFNRFSKAFRKAFQSVVKDCKKRNMVGDVLDDPFAELSAEEWAKAYYIHLCTYFDGPDFLRKWVVSDTQVVHFTKGDPAYYWFEAKRMEGRQFKMLRTARSLKTALAELLGENRLLPGSDDENFMYFVNFMEYERKNSTDYRPLAVVVVPRNRELSLYIPHDQDGSLDRPKGKEMFDDMVWKVLHLRKLRYRVVVIYDSEWDKMNKVEQKKHLAALLVQQGEEVSVPTDRTQRKMLY